MTLKSQFGVEEIQNGRGRNKRLLLVKDGQWLVVVRHSYVKARWLVTTGGPCSDLRVIGSAHDYESARELAHKICQLPMKEEVA